MSCNISNLINCLNPFNLCSKTEVDQFDIPMENLNSSSEEEYVTLEISNPSSPIPTTASPVQIAQKQLENKEYKKKQTALVKAVGLRGLTQAEVRQKGFSVIIFNTIDDSQAKAFEKTIEAERAEQKFYEVFRERCVQLGIQPSNSDFAVYAYAAMNGLTQESQTKETSCFKMFCYCCAEEEQNDEVTSVKMGTTILNFSKRVFEDIVNDYANHPIEFITPESFLKQVQFIKGFFPENSSVEIEASLRKALLLKHEGSFIKISREYLDSSYDNRRVNDIAYHLVDMFRSEKMVIEAELAALRGPTGWNGTINAAQEKMNQAEIELKEAEVKFHNVYNNYFSAVSTNPEEMLAALNNLPVPCALQEVIDLFKEKHAKFEGALFECNVLKARLNVLAQWDWRGDICGGEFFDVCHKLGNVQNIARREAVKIGDFYRELNLVVNEKNKQVRYNQMHKFI